MPDHMPFLSCWLITCKLLHQFYCCWLLLTELCFLLSIVTLFHTFSTSPEKMHLGFMTLGWIELQRTPSTTEFCREETPPSQKLIEQKLQPYTLCCFKTRSWKDWKQLYLHQNFLWLCNNDVAPGIYSDMH